MSRPNVSYWSPRFALLGAVLVSVVAFVWVTQRFFPNIHGNMGHDYALFLPYTLAGYYWQARNGFGNPAEFVPGFCGGMPLLFDPQSMYYSLPQWLVTFVPPVKSFFVTTLVMGVLGGVAMYALLRQSFGVSVPAAALGAVLFMLNGFFTARMAVGHVTYHTFMLLPAMAWAILVPAAAASRPSRREIIGRSIFGGLLVAYVFYGGGINNTFAMAIAIMALFLVLLLKRNLAPAASWVAFGTVAIGTALSAYKLLPAFLYAAHVTRPTMLQLTDNLLGLMGGLVISLFFPQVLSHLPRRMTVVGRHELEYGVGIVPLVIGVLVVWALWRNGGFGRMIQGIGRRSARDKFLLATLCLLLAMPLFLNFDGPGMRKLLLNTPIIKSMSSLLRLWAVYIPILCVVAAWGLDYLLRASDRRMWWAAAAILVTVAQLGLTDLRYYDTQPYNPTPIEAAYARVREGEPVPAVTMIADPWANPGLPPQPGAARNDAVVEGVSAIPCDQSMFGYHFEVFPPGTITAGPVTLTHGDRLNLRNPVCYIFGETNDCKPGDEFLVTQRSSAEAFAAWRPYPHRWPSAQYVCTGLSVATAVGSVIWLLVAASRWLRASGFRGGLPRTS